VIYPSGLGVQQAKVEAIARIPRPTDVSRVRAFMGLTNYYCRYVKGFSAMAKPLNMLLKLKSGSGVMSRNELLWSSRLG
jgi:hypothetical protein